MEKAVVFKGKIKDLAEMLETALTTYGKDVTVEEYVEIIESQKVA